MALAAVGRVWSADWPTPSRAHQAYLAANDIRRAAGCAFWIGHNLLFRGEPGRASGWFARAQRLLEGESADCVERGYLLQVLMLEHELSGDFQGASAVARQIADIGDSSENTCWEVNAELAFTERPLGIPAPVRA